VARIGCVSYLAANIRFPQWKRFRLARALSLVHSYEVAESPQAERPALRILVLEDDEDDFALLQREIARIGWAQITTRVQARDELLQAISGRQYDLVISDWSMPGFDALGALTILQERKIDLPFIIVSGTIGEEAAVRALKAGASDFVAKGNLQRLGPSILRELREAQIRRERRDALEALRQAVKVRDDFLSIAGHELRTPLTTLRLQVQGILRSQQAHEPVEQLSERLQLVERSTQRLHALVDRMLDINQVAQQGVILVKTETDLARIVREAAARFSDGRISVEAPAPVVGHWDEARLDTLATNLIANALKYGEGKPVKVTVAASAHEATLTVQDQGIGIAPEDQKRIFERFGRAVSDRRYGGFGIGLWLVREIALAHAGKVELVSSIGTGATFVVHLPKT
jgi:signal transduction histidine kinase